MTISPFGDTIRVMENTTTVTTTIRRRTHDEPFGRFGGGWQWAVGVKVGRRSVALELLIFSVVVTVKDEATGTISQLMKKAS